MVWFSKILGCAGVRDHQIRKVVLSFKARNALEQEIEMENGEIIGIRVSEPLKPYDVLRCEDDGEMLQVVPEAEDVVCVRLSDRTVFAKICYYFGSRNIPLQILPMSFYFLPDHAVEKACVHFGLVLNHEFRPFVPEVGAYAHHGPHYADLYSFESSGD